MTARWFGLCLPAFLLLMPAAARGSDPTCNDAYTATQTLRREGKLRAARTEALGCGQDRCSTTVRTDCAEWLKEIEHAMPSIVIDARDSSGKELAGVHVKADGETLAERLDGKQIFVDPGDHAFRFVSGGHLVEQHVLVREGEKFRILHVEFPETPENDSAPAPDAEKAPLAEAREAPSALAESSNASVAAPPRAVPLASYALGGAGVLAVGAFVGLGVSTYSRELDLRHTCGSTHTCAPPDIDSVRTRYLVADVALGVGVVSLAAAIVLFLTASPAATESGPSSASALDFSAEAAPFSGKLVVRGRF